VSWIADVVPDETISSTSWGNIIRDRVVQVFDSDADRNANAHPREGMLAWSRDAHRLAVWINSTLTWQVIVEPYTPYTPRLWVGVTEFGIDTLVSSGYRRIYGACQFYVSCRWGILPPDDAPVYTGDISMLPPMHPKDDTNGGFGVMYVTPMSSTAPEVGFGLFNGVTTLSGTVPYPGQLAIGSPKDGRLLNRGDLTAAESGLFYCFASGEFPTLPELT
jgi:hypothetical protein